MFGKSLNILRVITLTPPFVKATSNKGFFIPFDLEQPNHFNHSSKPNNIELSICQKDIASTQTVSAVLTEQCYGPLQIIPTSQPY